MRTIKVFPKDGCSMCRGTGEVVDWVPYGSGNAPMTSLCDCIEEQVHPDLPPDTIIEIDLSTTSGLKQGKPHEHYD